MTRLSEIWQGDVIGEVSNHTSLRHGQIKQREETINQTVVCERWDIPGTCKSFFSFTLIASLNRYMGVITLSLGKDAEVN